MTKAELLKKITEKTNISRKETEDVLSALSEIIMETLTENREEKIPFEKLGSFKVKNVSERKGQIILGEKAGEEYCVPAHDEITFKMSKSIKTLKDL